MKKNQILNFRNWYESEIEGNGSNYILNNFNDDINSFTIGLTEYAVEFAMSFHYNPFMVENNEVSEHINKMKDDLKCKDTTFSAFSSSKSNGVPGAILGKGNYLKYLQTITITEKFDEIEKVVSIIPETNSNEIFTKEELFKKFTHRLITQDRFYNFLNFPISLYKRIFYNYGAKKYFDNLIKSQIDEILFHTENKKYLFSEIETLEINKNGSVSIIVKGQSHKLHTLIAGEENTKPIKTTELKNIQIDHIIPFEKLLFNIKDELPLLSNIHKILISKNNSKFIKNRKELVTPTDLFLETINLSEGNIKRLKKELKMVFSKSKLQLMDRTENLAKRKY